MDEYISHIGVKRRSGRYPWGSGREWQRSLDIAAKNDKLKGDGLNEVDRASSLGMTVAQLRAQISYAKEGREILTWETVQSRLQDGKKVVEIANALDIPESTVRRYRDMPNPATNKNVKEQLTGIKNMLAKEVSEKKYLDIGAGSEIELGVKRQKLDDAIKLLESSGDYYTHVIPVRQLSSSDGRNTNVKVLTKDPDWVNVVKNKDKIRNPESWSDDGGKTFLGLNKDLVSVDSKKVKIVYKEEGGEDKDGMIELRRTKDLDLGNSKYAQVRIAVDGTHYLKGMAMHSDDLPAGKDIVFYTNKHKGTPMQKVLKELKDDPDNRFGATIKPNGQRGALNIVNEEGDWKEWTPTLSSQFLSKQPYSLIKDRVAATVEGKNLALKEIQSISNPTLKKQLLNEFADGLDGAARSLKLQSFPKTGSHVILPFPNMKANEIYAPNYKNGEKVVLLRHPHGGRFELAELTVNNKGPAKSVLKDAVDAVGIHPSVASKMSGADFDGDTVLVIPNRKGSIKTMRSLEALKNFDPNEQYGVDRVTITPKNKQTQMGIVSNLITDMTIKDAPLSDLVRAVKHSMVVIDSEKHKLDWRRSAEDNGIAALQKRYQAYTSQVEVDPKSGVKDKGSLTVTADLTKGKYHAKGASTLISLADKEVKVYSPTKDAKYAKRNADGTYTEKIGPKYVGKVNLMDLVDDAHKLSSGTNVENAYADYVNTLKKTAASVRKDAASISGATLNKEAAKKYAKEVESIKSKLNVALSNAPKERQAQILANKTYSDKLRGNDIDNEHKKKLRSQALVAARKIVGASGSKTRIKLTDEEWEAIQNDAVNKTTLERVFRYSDADALKQRALPKEAIKVSAATRGRVLNYLGNGYTQSEIAEALGISTTTINAIAKGKD